MPIVSTEWLAGHLGDPHLRVLDASWYLPTSGRDARGEYLMAHIPGAIFFDLDAASAQDTPLPHMLPTAGQFAAFVSALGVGDGDQVVVYDGSGVNLSAARVWWMFRYFGHDRVAVLDGGSKAWREEGWAMEGGAVALPAATFTPSAHPEMVRDVAAMRAHVADRDALVVDMRSTARFSGRAPEPRPGLQGGHIPGSVNLPFDQLVGPDGRVLDEPSLRALLADAGVALDRPVVATCGSGTSACALLLNLERLGAADTALYDGSWSEWGQGEQVER